MAKSEITTISLDPESRAYIAEKAKKVGLSVSAFIRMACLSYPDVKLVVVDKKHD